MKDKNLAEWNSETESQILNIGECVLKNSVETDSRSVVLGRLLSTSLFFFCTNSRLWSFYQYRRQFMK